MPEETPAIEEQTPSSILLEVDNLTIEHRSPLGETILAPREVSLFVNRGEIVALVGERGCGKTAITQAMAGLYFPGSKKLTGDISFEGEKLDQLSRSKLREIRRGKIAFLLNDPHSQLNPFATVRQHLRETIQLAKRTAEFPTEAEWAPIFYEVGIIEPERILDRRPDTISTEVALRTMLATALFTGADLLVVDQVMTAVDPATALQILELIRQFRTERNLAILMTTDNLLSTRNVADRVIVLFEGGIVEIGTPERIIQKPRNPYTRALIDAIPRLGEKRTRLGELSEDAIREGRIAIHKNSAI